MRGLATVWGAGLLLAAACAGSGGRTAPSPPDLVLAGCEPAVARRILEGRQAVLDDPVSAAAWGRLGELLDIHGFAAEAVSSYERAAVLDPREWRWPYFAGIVLGATDPERSRAQLSRAAGLHPDYPPIHFYLGVGQFLADDLASAEREYARAFELDPECVNALLGLARVALARGEPRSALPQLERAARLAPEEPTVRRYLARALRGVGDQARAEREEQLAAASQAPERDTIPLRDPARDEVVLREGASSTLLRDNGRRWLARAQPDEARKAFEQAVAADPSVVSTRLELSRTLASLGQLDRALEQARAALALDPDSSGAQAALGDLFVRQGRIQPAIESYERALRLDPDLAEVKNNLAALFIRTGREAQGLELLRATSREHPGNFEIQFNLATLLVEAGRTAEARTVLEAALALRPEEPDAHYLLGTVQGLQGQWAEAVRSLRRVLELDPAHIEARVDLGRALWKLGRYADAVAALREAARAAPADPEASRELAWALATCPSGELRDGALALSMAERLARESNLRDPRLLDLLAVAHAERGDFRQAVEIADRGLALVDEALRSEDDLDASARRRLEAFRGELGGRLKLYRQGRPYRAPS